MYTLSQFCKTLNLKLAKEKDAKAKVDDIRTYDINDNGLDDIVSTFWQHDDIQADIEEKLDQNKIDDDACFSADEIEELRDIFHTQTLTQRKKKEDVENDVNDDDEKTDMPDDCFFMPDMNRTLERTRCTSEEEEIRSQLESGLLGESPNRAVRKSSIGKSSEENNEKLPSSLEVTKTQSSSTVKSSLEVLMPDSPKPELSIGSSMQHLNSYNSSVGSSAFADTLPIEESDQTKSLTNSLSSKSSLCSQVKDTSSSNSHKDSQVDTSKLHKNKKSRRLSVVTVPNTIPEVVEVDETSQEKAKCQQVTAVGTMYFSEDDFKSFVSGGGVGEHAISDVSNQVIPGSTTASTDVAMREDVVLIARDTATATTTGSETEDRPDDDKIPPRKSKEMETSVQDVDDTINETNVCTGYPLKMFPFWR